MRYFFVFLCLLVFSLIFSVTDCYAQYYPNYDLLLKNNNNYYSMPWVGGFNSPQFSSADLNNDGINDLVVFDRVGFKVLTFVNNGTPNAVDYHYAPIYEKNFPGMDSWCLLLDFNCDGIEDIFTHTTLGCKVFKGYYNANSELCFSQYSKLLKFQGFSGLLNIFISSVDIPAFVDIDNDNDIDILTFEITGGWMDYYKNLSQELGFGCDSFKYQLADQCWGLMFEPATRAAKDLNQPCPFRIEEISPVNENNLSAEKGGGIRHAGSATLAFDNDGDGDKEVIIGDISFSDLVYLTNGGTDDTAFMISQDTMFPVYSVPADIDVFPAAFYFDMDNDGIKDIVAAPNIPNNQLDINCSWFYKNTSSNNNGVFIFQTDSFLINQMVDVGTGALPVFTDFTNDGLNDILISNHFSYGSNSSIIGLKNIGVDTLPEFEIVTGDWMNLYSLNLNALYPAFGDLDNDGKKEMILGNQNGTLLYFENIGGGVSQNDSFILANPAYFSSDVGNNSTPQLVDLNADGLLDIIVGDETGLLTYYRNTGTASNANFPAAQDSFGLVNVQQDGQVTGYSIPCFLYLNNDTTMTLLVGCEGGNVFQYNDIENNLGGSFYLVDSSFSGIFSGSHSSVSASDINSDLVQDLIVGNYRGGATIYDTSSAHNYSVVQPFSEIWNVKIFPNPAREIFTIMADHEFNELKIYNAMGQLATEMQFGISRTVTLQTQSLNPGIYLVRLKGSDGLASIKLLIL